MNQGEFYAAVYGIIRDESGKILMQRRANTGFNDGVLQLPSGHLEGEETYFETLKREMKEELNIDIEKKSVKLGHVGHRICRGGRVYYDIFLEVSHYSGKIQNNEPDKCSELDFFNIEHPEFAHYNKEAIKHIQNGIQVSEIFM